MESDSFRPRKRCQFSNGIFFVHRGSRRKELIENEKWYTIEELASLCGISVETLKKGESPLTKLSIDFEVESRLGGYHNTQKFYSENVLKALKEYQIKNSVPNATADKETALTGNVSFIQNQTVKQAIDNLLDNPTTLQMLLNESLARSQKLGLENKQLRDVIKQQAPKVEFYDDVAGSSDTIDMKEVAKVLNIKGFGRNNIFELLRCKKVLDNNNQPYQKYVDSGYFRIIESRYTLPTGEVKISLKTVVFQKGLGFIRKLIAQ